MEEGLRDCRFTSSVKPVIPDLLYPTLSRLSVEKSFLEMSLPTATHPDSSIRGSWEERCCVSKIAIES
uniref:Uncharacterized protein n=1 Tax=Trichuris muris TaxID=70415 RepID=A0A5S6QDE9_TRIMR